MSYYTDYTQTYPSDQPIYETALEPYNTSAADYLAFGLPPNNMALSNITIDMENDLVWNPNVFPPFLAPNDFGYAVTNDYGLAASAQDTPYFVPNLQSIAPQPTVTPPIAKHFRRDDFGATYHDAHARRAPHHLHANPAMDDPYLDPQYPAPRLAPVPIQLPPAPPMTTPPDRCEGLKMILEELWGADGDTSNYDTLTPVPVSIPAPPPAACLPHTPSTPDLSRGSSTPVSSRGGYRQTPPYALPGSAHCPPTITYIPPLLPPPSTTGDPAGLSMRPDYTNHTPFEATEPLTSLEGSSTSALNKTKYRSKTTSPWDGSLSESEARGSLSLALPRPTMAPPTPGSSSGHKRKAEEEEREEEEDRPKKKKQKKQTQTAAPRAPRTPRAATSKAPLVCPVEDCLRTSTESGGWTRHIFHTHRYEPNLAKRAKHEKELWVCACGRCFMRQRAREAHARVCARASGAVPVAAGWTWAGWDAWIEEIRRTKGASLRAEYRRAGAGAAEGEEAWMARVWDRLGVAGVLISMQTSDAARCRPRRQHVGQAKTTVRQDVQGRYAKIARLRAVGGE